MSNVAIENGMKKRGVRNGSVELHAVQTQTPKGLIGALGALFPERETVVQSLVTAAVAGQHAFMIGPPGTAKSLLARTLAASLGANSYFELLMTRFTTPEEVFGPVKLSGLQHDRYQRQLEGYLPTAEVVMLDEIWKSSSAIVNALLTALNERVFHDDGEKKQIPLGMCLSASNELPESEELNAIYDRFLVRVQVDRIADRDSFKTMLLAPAIEPPAPLNIEAEREAASRVVVTAGTIDTLLNLRDVCHKESLYVSDRRWKQCLSLVRASAHIDGRVESDPFDLECLEHVLWNKPDERAKVAQVIQKCVSPDGAKAVKELDAAREILSKIPDESVGLDKQLAHLTGAVKDITEIAKRVAALPAGRKVDAARAEIASIKTKIGRMAAKAAGIDV